MTTSIFIHGDNRIASRNALNQEIAKSRSQGTEEVIRLSGEEMVLTDLIQAVEAKSLFPGNKLVVIENLLGRRPSKEKDRLLDYLKTTSLQTPIIFWEPKSATVAQLKALPKNLREMLFKVSPKIFAFLDALSPGNFKTMLRLYHQCLESETPEMVFYMMTRRISQLLMSVLPAQTGNPDASDWQMRRLVGQSKKFTKESLMAIHEKLFAVDRSIKTGKNFLPLGSLLDLVIYEI